MKILSALLAALVLSLPALAKEPRTIEIAVTARGFEPTPVKVKKGEPLKLVVTRKVERTCAKDLILKEHDIHVTLPLDKPVEISFTPSKTGALKYGCSMGQMIAGVIVVE